MSKKSMPSGHVCLVFTTMGRVLLQFERATTLPFHYPRLVLLLSSLLQFATSSQNFARVQLKNGFSVVLSMDATASVACAVVYSGESPATGEHARLTSLVVLRELLARFRDVVERIVEENRADAERMAEAYTLSSALEGDTGAGHSSRGGDEEDGTMDNFLDFQKDVVARLLEPIARPESRSASNGNTKEPIHILLTHVMNAETGVSVTGAVPANQAAQVQKRMGSNTSQQLVRRAAHALQLAFPLLYHTSLLKRRCMGLTHSSVSLGQGLANANISATTIVLRVLNPGSSAIGDNFEIAIRMFHHGTFAAVVQYYAPSEHTVFHGRNCELLRDGQLQRTLISDPRGAALTRLIHDAEASTSFALHIGSDGAPPVVLAAIEDALGPWSLVPPFPRYQGVEQ